MRAFFGLDVVVLTIIMNTYKITHVVPTSTRQK